MDKRGNGEGSIYRRESDGMWVAAIYRNGHRRVVYAPTRQEAAKKLQALLRTLEDGTPVRRSQHTVEGYLREWLAAVRPGLKAKTWERYEGCLRLHVIPELGGMPLAKLQTDHLHRLYELKLAGGLSPSSVHQVHRTLRTALEQAVTWGTILRNPAAYAKPPRLRERPMMVLDTMQCLRLLEVAQGRRLEALFVLAVTTGMREGELLALHWGDVDLSRGVVAVTGTLSRSRAGLEITDPKTLRARRQILLTAQAVQALQRHRLVQARTRLSVGARWAENDLVFPTMEGRLMDRERLLRRHFAPLLRDSGLPHMRFHDLRHTAATQMLQRGVHPRVVADILGHSDPAITLRVYSHVVPAMHDQAARAMEGLFDRSE